MEESIVKTQRILSFFLAAMMIATTLIAGTTVAAKLPFNDTDGHWGEAAIDYILPLIAGEVETKYSCGLPVHLTI